MKAPRGLGPAGKKAWERAVRVIEHTEDPDRFYDLAERYAASVDRADKARIEWRKEGEPMVSLNPNGASGAHPLIKVIEDADKLSHRFGAALRLEAPARALGRPQERVPQKAQGEPSKVVPLKAVA